MIKFRQNPYFRFFAIILGICFSLFAFHAVVHSEHAFQEASHQCPVCQAIAVFLLLIVLAFCLKVTLGEKQAFSAYALLFDQNPTPLLFSSRAPPLFS